MVTSTAKSVDEYLRGLEPERRAVLARLRALVRKTRPRAVESMAYGMPAYVEGGGVCAFSAQKLYYSLYVCDAALVARFKARLPECDIGKGCIRFKHERQLPPAVVTELLRRAKPIVCRPESTAKHAKQPTAAAPRRRARSRPAVR